MTLHVTLSIRFDRISFQQQWSSLHRRTHNHLVPHLTRLQEDIDRLTASPQLGATIQRTFKFGLQMAMIEGSATLFPTGNRSAGAPRVSTTQMSYYPMVDFCTNINMGASPCRRLNTRRRAAQLPLHHELNLHL